MNAFMTRWDLRMLRRRAHTGAQFERFAAPSPFGACELEGSGIGIEVRLRRGRARPDPSPDAGHPGRP
ncbi:MAG TPA: hypothetical protein VKY90_07755 [Candidatus Dormibacteraeota bacterium]|nr:hypothetical protein [Candidatus Dormibacteraeota bacterium]